MGLRLGASICEAVAAKGKILELVLKIKHKQPVLPLSFLSVPPAKWELRVSLIEIAIHVVAVRIVCAKGTVEGGNEFVNGEKPILSS